MTGTTGGRAHRLVTPAVMLAPRVRTGVESGGGGPGVVRDMAPGGSVDVGVEDHSLLGSYRSSHLKLTRDFILGFGPYPVLYFYPEKPREMQSSGMSMSPAVETSHPPLAHPPGDGADLHPTPAVDVLIYETLLWLSRPKCLDVCFDPMTRPWRSQCHVPSL